MIQSVAGLEQVLSTPSDALVDDMTRLDGDIMLLGAGGKMGPSLARLARNAVERSGNKKEIIAVSRFSEKGIESSLQAAGIKTLRADVLDDGQLAGLPDAPNILYLVARKFGTTGSEHMTWALNTYLPGRIAERFRASRVVAFSSGNVYPLTPVQFGGASEAEAPEPVGEYAQSVLGRERMFAYGSALYGTHMCLLRLNYAIDLRYGVLLEVAQAVNEGRTIDLRMGHANVIWQGDANTMALRAFHLCSSPPTVLNVTGPETVSIRWLAGRFGKLLGRQPMFEHEEACDALLNNAARAFGHFGYPQVTLEQMIGWVAHWVSLGGATHNKPSHFQEREGKF